ncbi:MAG: 30S ribosomal protein S6 [Gemmatimonadota bacterium]
MRDYEVVYIFKSSLGTEDIEARVQRYHEKILAGADAAITAVVHWGKRELAYPIENDRNGYYVVAQFTAGPDVLPGFERALKLDDDLLRHLVVISEGELPTLPIASEEHEREEGRPRSEDEDEPAISEDEDEPAISEDDSERDSDADVDSDSDEESDDVEEEA